MWVRGKGAGLESLSAKGVITHKSLRCNSSFIGVNVPIVKVWNPSNSYSNTVGTIWLIKNGNYANRE